MTYRYDSKKRVLYGTPSVRPGERGFRFHCLPKATDKAEAEAYYAHYKSDAGKEERKALRRFTWAVQSYVTAALNLPMFPFDFYTALALGEDCWGLYDLPPKYVHAGLFVDFLC